MADPGKIRILDGLAAIFVRETGDGRVVVSAGHKGRTLLKDNWLALPIYGAAKPKQPK